MNDGISKMAGDVIAAAKSFIVRSLEPVLARLTVLEGRAPEKGDSGKDGVSVDLGQLSSEIIVAAAKAVEALPKPKDGANGKDFDPLALEAAVKSHVASLPKPADGKDADSAAITAGVLEQVMKALEKIPAPQNGKDGKDFDPQEMRVEVARAVAALPPAKQGDQGRDGKDFDPAALQVAVKEAFDAIPRPKDGDPGRSVTVDDVAPLVEATVTRAFEALPKPKDGTDGKDIDPEAVRAEIRKAVAELPKPEDGKDGRDADVETIRSVVANELVKLPKPENGKDADPAHVRAEVERAVAALPKPKDGADGFSVDDLDIDLKDGGRILAFTFKSGGRVKTFEKRTGLMVYREVYRSGAAYEKGDAVTYGGALWIALKATSESPGNGAPDWRLAVKKS